MHLSKRSIFSLSSAGLALLLIVSLFALPSVAAQPAATTCSAGYTLWANGQDRDETLLISGSNNTINGAVRSNADLRLSGSDNRISDAVEYVTLFEDGGDRNLYPQPLQVAAAPPPVAYNIADYRPGGAQAVAAAAAGRYTVVNGDLDISEPVVLNGLYYVTGEAKLAASDISGVYTVVAEGAIDVSGGNVRGTPYADGLLLFSNQRERGTEVIKMAGSDADLRGVIYAPGGSVEFSGSNNRFAGIALGDALTLNGSSLSIAFAAEYCPNTTPPPTSPAPTVRVFLPYVIR